MKLSEATKQVFKDGVCRCCDHPEGDHERFEGTAVWTCDHDGCEDELDCCRPDLVMW